ncbi:MAG TPA: M28 family peptidase, partial [Candidatus Limnocylindrales bacterium]|nr:M28 family peptidase [Candidatus Limnocylindrales bacterium]
DHSASASGNVSSSADSQPAIPSPGQFEAVGPALRIDANRAWQYVKEIIALGPRWDGSPGQKKLGSYLHAKLKNVDVEEDAFVSETPAGKIPMRNIVAKFTGTKDGIIVLGSHIDTNYPLRDTTFIGANDGASSTALLLAIADQLRGRKLEGYSVWLAFLDGEESIPSSRPGDLRWDDNQSLYGSRHLARKWQQDGTSKKVKAFILLDMIGDKDLDVLRDTNSTPWLEDLVGEAARRLGYQSYFFELTGGVEDDHTPFAQVGIPVADVIDIDYGYRNSFHHTTQDTLDKLSPNSLQVAGNVVLETIRLVNGRKDSSAPNAR